MRGRKDPLRGVTCGVTCKSWQTRRPPPTLQRMPFFFATRGSLSMLWIGVLA